MIDEDWREITVSELPVGELPAVIDAIISHAGLRLLRKKSWGEVEFALEKQEGER